MTFIEVMNSLFMNMLLFLTLNIEKLKRKMSLPPEILAFKLLRKANITKDEKLLVLTGMNYENRKTLYDQAKKSLKKSKGDNESSSSSINMKLEPTFLAENEKALMADGYRKAKGRGKKFGGGDRETWKRGRLGRGAAGLGEFQRTEYRSQPAQAGGYKYTESGSRVTQPRVRDRKNMNPTGPDCCTLTCKSCGSFITCMPR